MTDDNKDSAYVKAAKAREAQQNDQFWWLGCLIPILLIGFVVHSCTREKSPEQLKSSADGVAIVQAREVIRSMLKDPGSAEFSSERIAASGAYCGRVNAKNSFGGYSGSQRAVVVGGMGAVEGDAALSGQSDDFSSLWSAAC